MATHSGVLAWGIPGTGEPGGLPSMRSHRVGHDGSNLGAAAAAKSRQSCPTLCDPIDGSPPGSPVSGILQARTLEWVAISFSNAWKWKVKVKSLSCVRLLTTPWTAAHQAPPSMRFSRQEYWSGVPLPSAAAYNWISDMTGLHGLSWTFVCSGGSHGLYHLWRFRLSLLKI